jgi:transforming growth factor-beta-induced protein
VETAKATPALSTLVGALARADLVDALSGDGPFTVFAPTNDAFDAISRVVAGLSKEQLAQVLEYHVVPGEYRAEDSQAPIFNLQRLVTLDSPKVTTVQWGGSYYGGCLANGDRTPIQIKGDTNTVTVTTRDVLCSNGVVHIVDAVIIPNLSTTMVSALEELSPRKSIVETAEATPALSTLVGALARADLVDALSGDGPFTVFAPTNDAFDAISKVVAGLSKEQLAAVLEYHVVPGEYRAESAGRNGLLFNLQNLITLDSPKVTTVQCGGSYYGGCLANGDRTPIQIKGDTNSVTVTTRDVLCSNGVVHIVDAVIIPNLQPPQPPAQNLVQLCESTPSLSILTAALVAADLTDTLSDASKKFTVFAPTDDAFDALPAGVLDDLMKPENKQELADILTYHVLSADLKTVVAADNLATNGVAHVIDGVLLPPKSLMV